MFILLWSVIHQHSTRSNKALAPPWTLFLETPQRGAYFFYGSAFNVYLTEGALFLLYMYTFDACVSGGATFFSQPNAY